MADIEKAIEREKEYLLYRAKNEEPFHLVDAVKECGFESLAEYFNAKKDYLFEQLEFLYMEKEADVCMANLFRMMSEKETAISFTDTNYPLVYLGESKPYNAEYCKENNITVLPLYTRGGAIVSSVGDLSTGICLPDNVGVNDYFILSKMRDIFGKYIENVTVDGNDILINGQKVCGSSHYKSNGMYLFVAHFSFTDSTELIKNVCEVENVQSVKVPTYITGITREQFKQEVREWLRV